MDVLSMESRVTEDPRNKRVANPAAAPKNISCFWAYPLSMALVANRLVQKTMVSGLEIVNKNTETKLEI